MKVIEEGSFEGIWSKRVRCKNGERGCGALLEVGKQDIEESIPTVDHGINARVRCPECRRQIEFHVSGEDFRRFFEYLLFEEKEGEK